MARYADSIYSDESQATQLLKNVVRGGGAVHPAQSNSLSYTPKDDYSLVTSQRAPVSNYRFSGAGTTQTPVEDDAHGLENTPASSWEPPGLRGDVIPYPPHMEANADSRDHDVHMEEPDVDMPDGYTRVSSRLDKAQSRPTRSAGLVAAIPSPAPTPSPPQQGTTRQRTMRRHQQRSPSPISDDSFAGPLPPDLQYKKHIAKTKIFHIPLSQLDQTQDDTSEEVDTRRGNLPPSSATKMLYAPARRGATASTRPFPRNEVLVAQTPSDFSQSQPHSLEARSGAGHSQQSSSRDASQADVSIDYPQAQTVSLGGDDPDLEASPWPSTAECQRQLRSSWKSDHMDSVASSPLYKGSQDATEAPTQPTSPVATQSLESNLANIHNLPQTGATDVSSVPASVLALVDARKLYRYKDVLAQRAQSYARANPSGGPSIGPNTFDETQPSAASHLPPTGEPIPDSADSSDSALPLADNTEETQLTAASNLPAIGQLALEHSPTLGDANYVDVHAAETQPSDASNLPPTGHLVSSGPSSSSNCHTNEPYGVEETQPSSTTNLPPTGQRIADELLASPYVPAFSRRESRIKSACLSDMDVVPDSEATQPEDDPAPTLSPEIPLPSLPPRPVPRLGKAPAKRDRSSSIDNTSPDVVGESSKATARREEEEESSSEDDDVPLAAMATSKQQKPTSSNVKGKRARAPSLALRPPPPKKGKFEVTASETKAVKTRRRLGEQPRRSDTESEPQSESESESEPVVPPPRKSKRTPAPKKKAKSTKTTTRVSRRLPTPATSGRRSPSNDDAADTRTEPADNDHMDVEEGSSRGKRSTRMPRDPSSRSSTTAMSRRTGTSAPNSNALAPATRVFALWHPDSTYYPGVVQSLDENGRSNWFLVHFDDGGKDTLEITHLRKSELRAQDDVVFDAQNVLVEHDTGLLNGEDTVVVNLRDGTHALSVKVRSLKIPSRSVEAQWGDRKLRVQDIVPVNKPKTTSLGSSTKLRKATAQSYPKLFAGVGFVLSYPTNTELHQQDKAKIEQAISRHGGVILSDWCDIFSMEGVYNGAGTSRVWTKDAVKLKSQHGAKRLDKVFLIADAFSTKPKYLIALGLGIPCLRHTWVEYCIREGRLNDFPPYLLPAGSCELFQTRISQTVDLSWCQSTHQLRSIMDNRVASKIFADKSILCVSDKFLRKKGSRSEDQQMSSHAIPQIILSMGPSRVEAVADLKHASQKVSSYDYIMVHDESELPSGKKRSSNYIVFSAWVKDCLIAGRILPRD